VAVGAGAFFSSFLTGATATGFFSSFLTGATVFVGAVFDGAVVDPLTGTGAVLPPLTGAFSTFTSSCFGSAYLTLNLAINLW